MANCSHLKNKELFNEIKEAQKMTSAIASEKVLAKDWNSKEDDVVWKNL